MQQRTVYSCIPTAIDRSIANRWTWHYRVLDRAFERLERLTVKVVRAVLRGLGGSNPARLPGIRRHMDVLWATDFFSTEVWTLGGLVTFYVLFFIKLDTREVHIAGVTSHPNEPWMMQVARNLTMEEWGVLKPGQYLMHDRDTKFCAAFKQFLDDTGVKRLPLPAKSPNLNAIVERWIRSVKEEALSKLILFGEQSLWYVLSEYVAHYHQERPHQGKGNVILFPTDRPTTRTDRPIRCRERLGGLLTYYDREAA